MPYSIEVRTVVFSKRANPILPFAAPSRPKNKLLASLPADEFERLRPYLGTLAATEKMRFYPVGTRIRDIVFLNGGVASVTTAMQDGSLVETATVGDEGLLGVEVVLGGEMAAGETMLQVMDGDASVLPVEVFRTALDERGALFDAAQRYARGLMALMMQSTACMAMHDVHERCCRWLLMTHDRVHHDEFRLSQEFLATMLGSTRPTVNVVAGALQKAGLISYKHGNITILDRGSHRLDTD